MRPLIDYYLLEKWMVQCNREGPGFYYPGYLGPDQPLAPGNVLARRNTETSPRNHPQHPGHPRLGALIRFSNRLLLGRR